MDQDSANGFTRRAFLTTAGRGSATFALIPTIDAILKTTVILGSVFEFACSQMKPYEQLSFENIKPVIYPPLKGHKVQAPDNGCYFTIHGFDRFDDRRGGYGWHIQKVGKHPSIMLPFWRNMEGIAPKWPGFVHKLRSPEDLIQTDWPIPFIYRDITTDLVGVGMDRLAGDKIFGKRIEDWGKNIAKMKKPMFFSTMQEMNGDWFPWGAKPKAMKDVWKFMWNIFEDTGANEYATWVWEIYAIDESNIGHINYPSFFYPGDKYVDWIGLSTFSRYTQSWNADKQLQDLIGYTVKSLHSKYPDKPIMIAELGKSQDSSQPKWIEQAYSYIRMTPTIKGVVYNDNWNHPQQDQQQLSEDSFKVLRKILNDPYFISGENAKNYINKR